MDTHSRVAGRRRLVILACILLAMAAAIRYIAGWSAGGVVPFERYYRAVFVLQSLGGPAAREPEDIPARVIRADATESLLHHPDKIFVLAHVAEELARARQDTPRAMLFEAYARLGLGERQEAARLLADYVIGSGYNAGHYSLLCETLGEIGDDSSLVMISREWRERDPSCRTDRILLTWAALHNLERYDQASDYMLGKGDCLGWQAMVYAAKSRLAAGGEREARPALESARKRYPRDQNRILRLWDQIKDRTRM